MMEIYSKNLSYLFNFENKVGNLIGPLTVHKSFNEIRKTAFVEVFLFK